MECDLCAEKVVSGQLMNDYDPQTHQIRGKLCERCSHDFGGSNIDPSRYIQAAYYGLLRQPVYQAHEQAFQVLTRRSGNVTT